MSPNKATIRSACRARRAPGGYLLFEVVLALTVFAFAMVGLVVQLERGIASSGKMERDQRIRIALEAVLNEVKEQEIGEMVSDRVDDQFGVTFATRVEPQVLENADGESLQDLYKLTATATWSEGGEELTEIAELTLYRPE